MVPPSDTDSVPQTVEIPGFGRLTMAAQDNAPLLVVFGGIDVAEKIIDPTDKTNAKKMVHSGDYMWKYFNNLRSRFHIFVANSPKVNGDQAYRQVLHTLQWKGSPPTVAPTSEPDPFGGPSQILYLFSGGYQPGMQLLNKYSRTLFSSIYLVDIWMGAHSIGVFYEGLASANAGKTYYVHTSFGANNESSMNSIVRKLGPSKAPLVTGRTGELGMQTHLRTNEVAVSTIL